MRIILAYAVLITLLVAVLTFFAINVGLMATMLFVAYVIGFTAVVGWCIKTILERV